MEMIMPIVTGIVNLQIFYIAVAVIGIIALLIIIIILQKYYKDSAKRKSGSKTTIAEIFPDENLQKAVAKNLGVLVNEPIYLEDLNDLKKMSVEYAGIKDLTGISKLKNLQEVSFSNNKIHEIPDELSELKNLQSLKIAYNNLTDVEKLAANKNLKSIDISGNKLSKNIASIYGLPELEELIMINTGQTKISPNVRQAKKLKRLNISYNAIDSIAEELTQLPLLEILNVGNNKLTTLPEEMKNMHTMTDLALTGNIFETIPSTVQELMRSKKMFVPKLPNQDPATDGNGKVRVDVPENVEANHTQALANSSPSADAMVSPKVGYPSENEKETELGTMQNTFIDLTSSNNSLLSELEDLEIIKPKEKETAPNANLSKDLEEMLSEVEVSKAEEHVPTANTADVHVPRDVDTVSVPGNVNFNTGVPTSDKEYWVDDHERRIESVPSMTQDQAIATGSKQSNKNVKKAILYTVGAVLAAGALVGTAVLVSKSLKEEEENDCFSDRGIFSQKNKTNASRRKRAKKHDNIFRRGV